MRLPDDFIRKLARCLEEEEEDIYTLSLYGPNSAELDYFKEKDRGRIQKIFKILKQDTRRHAELLRLIVELGEPS